MSGGVMCDEPEVFVVIRDGSMVLTPRGVRYFQALETAARACVRGAEKDRFRFMSWSSYGLEVGSRLLTLSVLRGEDV